MEINNKDNTVDNTSLPTPNQEESSTPKKKREPNIQKKFQKYWEWAPDKLELFCDKKPFKSKKVMAILPSIFTKEQVIKWKAVQTEVYPYFLEYEPILVVNTDEESEMEFVVGLRSLPVKMNTSYPTISEWKKLLKQLSSLEHFLIVDCMEFSDSISQFSFMCFDPTIIQAVDMLIKDILLKESKYFIDKLGSI